MKKLISLLLVLTLALSLVGGAGIAALADEPLPEEIVGQEELPAPEGEDPAPVEDEDPAPVEGEDPAPVEDEDPAPVEDEDPAPVEGETVVEAELVVVEEEPEAVVEEAANDGDPQSAALPASINIFVAAKSCVIYEGSLSLYTPSGEYSTGKKEAVITATAVEGGYTLAFSEGGQKLGCVEGQLAVVETAAVWTYDGTVLKCGDFALTGEGLAMGETQGAAVKIVQPSSGGGTPPSGGGGGGGGGVYTAAITEAAAPNLIFVEAPHWVNLSKEGHETEKEVSLQARFPEGITADGMTFSWSFGEEAFEEFIPTAEAVDGVFTSTWTVSIAELEAGVYPVSCAITYSLGDEILVTEPDTSITEEGGDAFTYTLGDEVYVLVESSNPGKPTVFMNEVELKTTDDTSTNPPTTYITDESLKDLEPGEYSITVTADGKSEEKTLTVVDPYTEVSELTEGGFYIITFEVDSEAYAVGLVDGAIQAVPVDEATVWTCEDSDGKNVFVSNGTYLAHNKTQLTASSKGGEISFKDGAFNMKSGGADRKLAGLSGTNITVDKNGTLAVTVKSAPAQANITVGDSYVYTLGIEKDLVMPGIETEIATVTIKGAETDYTLDPETGEITIGFAVIEALSAGSYTVAITDVDGAIVNHKLTVQKQPTIDVNVNVILANGVQANSLITFSDVHESWDDVGTAVYDTIIATNGFIPALIIATGDFNNDRVAGNKEAYITGCVNEIINRVSLQLAGIDTVWVSGNHDNGFATQYTNYNLQADLGINLSDYASGPVSGTPTDGLEGTGVISGTGIIFDTRSAGYQANAESSAAIDQGLVVIGLNYEDGDAFSKNDYGTGEEEGDSVYKHIQQALDNVAANYNGELVVISSHAGLHNLAADADGSSSHNDNSYSISNSAAIVKLVNSYVENYGMDIMWLFGHDHSKNEGEFVKLPGAIITSTNVFGAEENELEDIELKFTYAHSGYVGSGAAGTHNNNYTYLTWDADQIIREERVADGNQTVRDYFYEGNDGEPLHISGSTGALSFKLARDGEFVEIEYDPMVPNDEQKAAVADMIPSGYSEKDAVWYDIYAQWTDANGNPIPGKTVEDDEFTLIIPYPDGTNPDDFDFNVLHIGRNGVEKLTVEETPDGLRVRVFDLSPFMVLYKATPKPAPAQGGTGSASGAGSKNAPKTGDDSQIVLWAAVLVLCAGTAVALPRRKWDK